MHEGLVGPRALVGTPYMADPGLRAEYAREIAPRTAAALEKILAATFPDRTASAGLRVLDLGAGTGAAGQAVRDAFAGPIRLASVDRIASGAGHLAGDVTDAGRLSRQVLGGQRFDLIVAAHLLNELEPDRQSADRPHRLARLVESWCDVLLADGGTLILVEPALRETSRVLLGVRDLLLGGGALRVVAPCFFAGPCPALARERDWCHDAAGTVDYSYLVLRRAGSVSPATDPGVFRIVSAAMPEKGRLRLFGCGLVGRHALVRLNRHESEANREFAHLQRGDVARMAPTESAADGLRIVADTTIERLAPRS
jgi:SAM-dependent methyltransferase